MTLQVTSQPELCTETLPSVPQALIVEDYRAADVLLSDNGWITHRITHHELLSADSSGYTAKLQNGECNLLWISSPSDWQIRGASRKSTAHWHRVLQWMKKAVILGMLLVVFGPPGYLWNIPNIKDYLTESNISIAKMRLCHFKDKYNPSHGPPSGSYLQVATTKKVPPFTWSCNCKVPIQDHILDWYGRHQHQAEWRRSITIKYIRAVCLQLKLIPNSTVWMNIQSDDIQNISSLPLPITVHPNLPTTSLPTTSSIFPTDARIRQKERLMKLKEQGIKPKKKAIYTEPGNDDCGDNLSGLGKDIILLTHDILFEDCESDDDDDLFLAVPHLPIADDHANVFSAISQLCYGEHNYVDILTLCGGEDGTSQACFRRGLTSGGNLDLTTDVDLGDPQVQKAVNHFLDTCYVLVVLITPNCRSVGKNSYFNSKMHYDTWSTHHQEDLPHIRYCAEVALIQSQKGRWWIREQPAGSWMSQIHPWTEVEEDPNLVSVTMEQCAAGARDPSTGYHMEKKTTFSSNSDTLLGPLRKLRCDGTHYHSSPTGKDLEGMKVYPRRLCEALAKGIDLLQEKVHSLVHGNVAIFPSIGTDAAPYIPAKLPKGGMGCAACHNSYRQDSPKHTRDPLTCSFPNVLPYYWKCPSCTEDKFRNPRYTDPGHTYVKDECRFASRGAPDTRSGAYPRDPRTIQTDHPTAQASSYDAALNADPSSSSSGPHEDPSSLAHGNVAGRPHGSLDSSQRTRRVFADTGSGSARLPEWNRFDIQVSLRNLRSFNKTVVQKELRKLHLRWWHAREPKMRTILSIAGLDETRLAMIKAIVDTCRECRAWQRRGNEVIPSIDISIKFNDTCETDLFFYKKSIGWHIICRAIRFSDGCQIPNKFTKDLLDAYTTVWVSRYGGCKRLYSDGETGYNCAEGKAELSRLGTELIVRAPNQHARLAETRQAMLRHVMHMIEEDLKRSSMTISFKRLYAEALFVVNCFSFYNGVSPYNALYGRQPACLPDFENPDFPKEGELTGTAREDRIRASAINAMTQSTAVAKIQRALDSKTTPDGNRLYKQGDLMDYHRPTPTKDEHGGWNGPWPVVRNEPERGQVICRTDHKPEVIVRYPDARRSLFLEAIFAMESLSNETEAMDLIINYIDRLGAGKTPETFGYSVANGNYILTSATKRAPKVFLALQFVIRNYFRISDVFAIRLGKSVHNVKADNSATSSMLIYYFTDNDPSFHFYETKDIGLDILSITNSPKAKIIQCLIRDGCNNSLEDDTQVLQELSPMPMHEEEPQETSSPDDPPTPRDINVGGDLPTIHEENEETDMDDYHMESWYAELQLRRPDTDEPLSEYEEMLGDRTPQPVHMMPTNTVVMFAAYTEQLGVHGNVPQQSEHGNVALEPVEVLVQDSPADNSDFTLDSDEVGSYVELCFASELSMIALDETQLANLREGDIATIRVYVSADSKRAVVVKEDDLLSKNEMIKHAKEVSVAIVLEIQIWIENKCFKLGLLKDCRNVMTSRYVAKWKWIKNPDGTWTRVIRMRLVLRGFMDLDAFSLDTFSGTAKRTSQRMLASEAACNPNYIIASLDVDKAFLKGFTYKELADATGEQERTVAFRLPPGSASLLRKFPGFEHFDESVHCLICIKPGTGTKDAPRAFSLKLKALTKKIGLRSTTYDPEFEVGEDINLLTAKHVDDVHMTGDEPIIDYYKAEIEKVFGPCKMTKHSFTNCGVHYEKLKNGDVTLDQHDYVKTLRPIVSSELTGAKAENLAAKVVQDQFVSLRGALAYVTLTQAWLQVYIVALQRIQMFAATNLEVRRLNAVTRKLQQDPKVVVFVSMKCASLVDTHTDSGYRRMTDAEDIKGYGMRGMCLLRRGQGKAFHFLDSVCKSHRLTIRSSYGAELISASHGFDDAYPTLVTLIEIKHGVLTAEQLKLFREKGGWNLTVVLTIDAESVFRSLTSRDLKTPAEKTLLGHVCWLREALQLGLIRSIRWCDTRDMVADGHTKGCIDRKCLIDLMHGKQSFQFDVKLYTPYKGQPKPSNDNDEQTVHIQLLSTETCRTGGYAFQ